MIIRFLLALPTKGYTERLGTYLCTGDTPSSSRDKLKFWSTHTYIPLAHLWSGKGDREKHCHIRFMISKSSLDVCSFYHQRATFGIISSSYSTTCAFTIYIKWRRFAWRVGDGSNIRKLLENFCCATQRRSSSGDWSGIFPPSSYLCAFPQESKYSLKTLLHFARTFAIKKEYVSKVKVFHSLLAFTVYFSSY